MGFFLCVCAVSALLVLAPKYRDYGYKCSFRLFNVFLLPTRKMVMTMYFSIYFIFKAKRDVCPKKIFSQIIDKLVIDNIIYYHNCNR